MKKRNRRLIKLKTKASLQRGDLDENFQYKTGRVGSWHYRDESTEPVEGCEFVNVSLSFDSTFFDGAGSAQGDEPTVILQVDDRPVDYCVSTLQETIEGEDDPANSICLFSDRGPWAHLKHSTNWVNIWQVLEEVEGLLDYGSGREPRGTE
jgi:hypothetical protein